MAFESVKLEQNIIAGLLRNPNFYYDTSHIISSECFHQKSNRQIFSVIARAIEDGETTDITLITQRCKDLGVQLDSDLNCYDYLEMLKQRPVNEKSFKETAAALLKVHLFREKWRAFKDAQKIIEDNKTKSLGEVEGLIEERLNKVVNITERDNEPLDLFDPAIEDELEEKGKNPVEEVGLNGPWGIFQQLYGGFTDGDMYVFVSPKKNGKSTLLSDAMIKTCCLYNENVKGLILDTELETYRVRRRALAAMSELGNQHGNLDWLLNSGQWAQNEVVADTMRNKVFPLMRQRSGKIEHIFVGNKSLEQVISITKRWHKKNVRPEKGEKGIICYDYLKLTTETPGNNMAEWFILGQKVSQLKELATQLQCPILTAAQTNREGMVAASSRIGWFASLIAFFTRKTKEELARFPDSGTHKLVVEDARNLGRDPDIDNDYVKLVNEKGKTEFLDNHINFNIENFQVTELNRLSDCVGGANKHKIAKSSDIEEKNNKKGLHSEGDEVGFGDVETEEELPF